MALCSRLHVTFLQITDGWILAQRGLFITEIIFSGGNVGNGHWCRFHCFLAMPAGWPSGWRPRSRTNPDVGK